MNVKQVIIIDDDKLSNMVSVMMLRRISESIAVTSYTNPVQGLEAVKSVVSTHENAGHILILLDLNMPEMSGWEFLDYYRTIKAETRNAFRIFILSSSVDERDMEKASEEPMVEGFMSKPLKIETIRHLFD